MQPWNTGIFVDDIVRQIIASLKRSSQVLHVGVRFNAFFTIVHCLLACLTMTDTYIESCFDSGNFRLVAILQHKSLLEKRSLVEIMNLKQ